MFLAGYNSFISLVEKGSFSLLDCLPLIPMFILSLISGSLSTTLEWDPEVIGATGESWHFTAI